MAAAARGPRGHAVAGRGWRLPADAGAVRQRADRGRLGARGRRQLCAARLCRRHAGGAGGAGPGGASLARQSLRPAGRRHPCPARAARGRGRARHVRRDRSAGRRSGAAARARGRRRRWPCWRWPAGDAAVRRRQMGPRHHQENHQGRRDLDRGRPGGGLAGGQPGHAVRRPVRLLRRRGGRYLQLVLQHLHRHPVGADDTGRGRRVAAEGRADHRADPRPDRLDRSLPPDPRRVHQAQGARICHGRRRHRRLALAQDVHPHLPQRQPRGAGADVDPGGGLHQGRGHPQLPRLRRAGWRGVVGQHAQRSAERIDTRPLVAAERRRHRHGAAGDGLLAVHRRPARRPRSQGEMMSAQYPENDLLEIADLRIAFRVDRRTTVAAVKGVSFRVPRNATVALVGESGSGKSVSALAVMGLLPPDTTVIDPASRIRFDGRDLLALSADARRALCGKDIAMIFQEPMSSLNPVFTVGAQIVEVLRLHMGMSAAQARRRTLELLDEVGIPDPAVKIDAYPSQMSGGQQQRVMIAMAIACEPKLLIADEPTTALDVTIQKQIMDLIAALQKKHQMSVLFITHDLGLVGEIADHVIVMRHGEVRETGEVRQVFEAAKDTYTQALLHCRPSLDERPWRLPVIADYMEGKAGPGVEIAQRTRGYTPGDEPVLVVKNLSKSFYLRDGWFGKREFQAVKDVSFTLPRGKTLGVVGESGSGKTTVGLTLLRLHQATGGTAMFHGKDLISMPNKEYLPYKRRIQIIFQNPYASLNPRFTVGQILLEPMRIHKIGADDAGRVAAAYSLLEKVGLPALAFHRYPHEFSGGQRQRIAIARCLTMKPEILVCDESVSALDVSVQAQVLNLLQDLQDEFGLSYIFISHDLSVVKYIADQVIVMHQGQVVEIGNSDDIYRHPSHPYTRTLLSAIPRGVPL